MIEIRALWFLVLAVSLGCQKPQESVGQLPAAPIKADQPVGQSSFVSNRQPGEPPAATTQSPEELIDGLRRRYGGTKSDNPAAIDIARGKLLADLRGEVFRVKGIVGRLLPTYCVFRLPKDFKGRLAAKIPQYKLATLEVGSEITVEGALEISLARFADGRFTIEGSLLEAKRAPPKRTAEPEKFSAESLYASLLDDLRKVKSAGNLAAQELAFQDFAKANLKRAVLVTGTIAELRKDEIWLSAGSMPIKTPTLQRTKALTSFAIRAGPFNLETLAKLAIGQKVTITGELQVDASPPNTLSSVRIRQAELVK